MERCFECLETSGLLLGGGRLRVSYGLVDTGETFGGVVAFECHARPCLSREATSMGRQSNSPLFCFEQCDEKAAQGCAGGLRVETPGFWKGIIRCAKRDSASKDT